MDEDSSSSQQKKSFFSLFSKKNESIEEVEYQDSDDLSSVEKQIHQNLSGLRETTADDIMLPSADIVALEVTTPMDEVIEAFTNSGHKKIPVYRGTLDDAVGLVTINEVLENQYSNKEPRELSQLVRPILFISPYMNVLELLLEMRERMVHMALVVDEFGGVDGLITIENILGEIVGEFREEMDPKANDLVRRKGDILEFHARLPLEDLEELLGTFLNPEERENFDTLGGLLLGLSGRVPAKGEIISHASGIEFEVIGVDVRRLHWLRLFSRPPAHLLNEKHH